MKKQNFVILLALAIGAVIIFAIAEARQNTIYNFQPNSTTTQPFGQVQCEKSYKLEYDNCKISYNAAVKGQNKNADEIDRLFSELSDCKIKLTPQYGNIQPSDMVAERQISMSSNVAQIGYENIVLYNVKNTGSMRPTISDTSHLIVTKTFTKDSIKSGDIISFYKSFFEGSITHRVVETGSDQNGWYAITKGDNNRYNDSEKVRFDKISDVVIAIIY